MSKFQAPQFLADLTDNVKNVLQKSGLTPETAHDLAYEITKEQRMMWRGQTVYFPSTDPEELSRRDQEIWDRYNGSNHAELVSAFQVSKQHIYRIVKIMRAKETSKRQGSLLT